MCADWGEYTDKLKCMRVEMFLSVWPRPQQPTHRDQLSQVIRVVVCNVHYGTEDPSTIGFV